MSSSKDRYHLGPYELSQDLVAKQLEFLENKYGGSMKAKEAALTIQRAFRRYSMAKKFALLTAQMKTEKRVGRRLESSGSVVASSQQHAAASKVPGCSAFHRAHYIHGSSHTPQRHSSSCRHRDRAARAADRVDAALAKATITHQPSLSANNSPPVQHSNFQINSSQDTDGGNDSSSSNSNPADVPPGGLQSFPLDETCVYAHTSQQQQHVGQPKSDSTGSLLLNTSRDGSPHGGRNRGRNAAAAAAATNSATAPHVPKRTVSRLSSLDNANLNNNKHNSSPRRTHHVAPATGMPAATAAAYYLPDVDVRLSKVPIQYRAIHTSSSAPTVTDVSNSYTVNEVIRKRHYRTGLNIFNKKPEKGITYLIRRGFLENSPAAVARFLITRKGLSKQMIGEYLGNITYNFNMAVLNCFAQEMDFAGMHIDTALRKFQTYFRMPGEAQKIERLMEVFSGRYCQCNRDTVTKLQSADTVFILAFAIILLNTDLHTPNLKPEKRMKLEDFIRNLRAIDDGNDLDHEMLAGIYERIRLQEFRPGSDHVTQVVKVQQTIVAKCPNLAVPHRRLVCYCRLYEVTDPHKKERPGLHQREVFLFNDILVITKIHSRKKNTVTYTFRQSYLLAGMVVNIFDTQFYPFGIQMAQKRDRKVVLTLNARNEHDRSKFVEDLKESIAEMDEMETLRLESELEKQRLSMNPSAGGGGGGGGGNTNGHDNRDSGITDGDGSSSTDAILRHGNGAAVGASGVVLRKSAINNSLLDLADASEKMTRRGSVGSLDSGMSISFQSNSVNSMCARNGDERHCYLNSSQHHGHHHHHHHHHQQHYGNNSRVHHGTSAAAAGGSTSSSSSAKTTDNAKLRNQT